MYRQKFDVKFTITSNNPFEIQEKQLRAYIEYKLGLMHMSQVEFKLNDIEIKSQTHEG